MKLDRLGVMSWLTGRQANGRVGGWFHRHHIAPVTSLEPSLSRECNRRRWRGYGGLRAQRRPAGCSPDGAARARVGVPAMLSRRPWRQGMFSLEPPAAPSSGAAADHVVALAIAGRVPWPAAQAASCCPGDPPYDARGRDSLNQSRAPGSDFQDAIRSRQSASNIPIHKTAPSFLNDGYPAENL